MVVYSYGGLSWLPVSVGRLSKKSARKLADHMHAPDRSDLNMAAQLS